MAFRPRADDGATLYADWIIKLSCLYWDGNTQLFYCIYCHGVAMIRTALQKANLVGKVVEVALAGLVDMAVLKYNSKGKITHIMVLLT